MGPGSGILVSGAAAGWLLLGSADESEGYNDVDMAEVWRTPEGYALLTASGCSCWGGEYESVTYRSLPLLALGLLRDEVQFGPSLMGALRLLKQVLGAERLEG